MSDDREGPWHKHCFKILMSVHRDDYADSIEFMAALKERSGVEGWGLHVGEGLVFPPVPDGWVSPWCYSKEGIDCGATCHLPPGHEGPHLCAGDTDGPGSCPA